MFLIRKTTLERVEAIVEAILPEDLKNIHKNKRFDKFDWGKEAGFDVYQLKLKDSGICLGLMSVEDIPVELRIEIRLIEVSKENIGHEKEYDRIAGCLIAFACQIAFKKNYRGFVSLVPKTVLIEHYKNTYGFEQFGRQLALDFPASSLLVKKYILDEIE